MGTSNWQNIPFCIESLMRIAPKRVLDVGVGFGRWGMIVREFCDVWFGRVTQEDWGVHLEGIEAFAPQIRPYHHEFYNEIHVVDAKLHLKQMKGNFDVIIFGDVLEHFTKPVGRDLLETALRKGTYVVVNVPLGEDWEQDEMYENPFERHLAVWTLADFETLPAVRVGTFRDFRGRDFGSFLLSARDPKGIAQTTFPSEEYGHTSDAEFSRTADQVSARIEDLKKQIDLLRSHQSMRIFHRLTRTPLIGAIRKMRGQADGILQIRALGTKSEGSKGSEVWLLSAQNSADAHALPWELLENPDGAWHTTDRANGPFGKALYSENGLLRLATDFDDPVLTFLRHPWSGKVEVVLRGQRQVFDLYSSEQGQSLRVWPARNPMVAQEHAPTAKATSQPKTKPAVQIMPQTTEPMPEWVERIRREKPAVLALHAPRWLGITAATQTLFESTLPFPALPEFDPAQIPEKESRWFAECLIETGVRHFVFSGGDGCQLSVARRLKQLCPQTRCDLLWHGSFLQFSEDEAWRLLVAWIAAAREGIVHSIGVVKKGMEEFFQKQGVNSKLVLNYLPQIPAEASTPLNGGPHFGIWISGNSYRKLPYATLAATAMIPGATIHGANLSKRAMAVIDQFNIRKGEISPTTLPREELFKRMAQTHLTLYVTLSECCPMLPLESFSQGVPCLIGPTSHVFEEDEYLFSRLVVPFPERTDSIVRHMQMALEEREALVRQYISYATDYNERARASVREFIFND